MKPSNISLIFAALLLSVAINPANAADDAEGWTIFHQNLAEDVQRIPVTMKLERSGSRFYDDSRSIKVLPIKEGEQKDGFRNKIDIGRIIDGFHYTVYVKDSNVEDITGNGSNRNYIVRVVVLDDGQSRVIKEGMVTGDGYLNVPFAVAAEKLNLPGDEKVTGRWSMRIQQRSGSGMTASFNIFLDGSYEGSTTIEKAFLKASIRARGNLKHENMYLNLNVRPFGDKSSLPTDSGKISEIIKIGSAQVVVEKMKNDGTKIVLAVVDGKVGAEPKAAEKQIGAAVKIGMPFPAFARIELAERKLVTLDDLTSQAGQDGYVVLLFGNLKRPMSDSGGRRRSMCFSLDERMIVNIVKKDVEKKVEIAFVCQEISLSNLYETWLGAKPEFYMLSDYSDPLNIAFMTEDPDQYGYRDRQRDEVETLSGNLNLGDAKTAAALIDGSGNLVYINTDVNSASAETFMEINRLIRDGQRGKDAASKQDDKN